MIRDSRDAVLDSRPSKPMPDTGAEVGATSVPRLSAALAAVRSG